MPTTSQEQTMTTTMTSPFDLALIEAHDLADEYFGTGEPVDLNADGYTCDEIGALADQFDVDGDALLDAVVDARGYVAD